ncbi:hydrophobin [Fusarium beomiforme]|uniref:Hydrophobin n=1 Tax=Fusarium beomiforme TaxID=44412 RepID=A0A9P5AAS7_9HYPO|nr:hydrophobin [Fusarium beomiforme]
MRFTALVLPIFLGAASAGPCRPSSAESSLTSSSETSELVGVTTIESLSSTFAATLSTEQLTDTTTITAPTTEIESASTTTSMVGSTTESTAAATSTTAASGQCIAPATLQCCNTVGTATDPVISLLLGLLGIVVRDQTTLLGATCSPLGNPAPCAATPLCCNDNSHGGLIAIGFLSTSYLFLQAKF